MKEYAELFTALAPIIVSLITWTAIIALALFLRHELKIIVDSLVSRISKGSELSFGAFKFGELPAERSQLSSSEAEKPTLVGDVVDIPDWTESRENIYDTTKGFYLYHNVRKSQKIGHKYLVSIFVDQHDRKKFHDKENIKSVQFFFGKYWQNRIFTGVVIGNNIGIEINAYGTFMATARIELSSNEVLILHRYIDFEGHEQSISFV